MMIGEKNAAYWNRLWLERRKILTAAGAGECAMLWNDLAAARRYAHVQETDPGGRGAMILEDLGVLPGSRVLDIGCGPGNLSLPLASRASHICAVEPAAGMAQVFRETAEARGITNVRLIPSRWEEVSPELLGEPYDVVFAAFSLGVGDLQAALEKMHQVCRGRVSLYWFAGESSWQKTKRELWPRLYGQELPAPPEEDLIAGMIQSLGYDLRVKKLQYSCWNEYGSLDELVEAQRVSYHLDSPEAVERFIQEFKPYLEETDGRCRVRETAVFNAYSWAGSAIGL